MKRSQSFFQASLVMRSEEVCCGKMLLKIGTLAELVGELMKRHDDIFLVLSGKDTECDFGDMKMFALEFVRKKTGKNENRVIYLGKCLGLVCTPPLLSVLK